MDDLCLLLGVIFLCSCGSSVGFDPVLFPGYIFLLPLMLPGESSQCTDVPSWFGDIDELSILVSPPFADDRELSDFSETTSLLSKVRARL